MPGPEATNLAAQVKAVVLLPNHPGGIVAAVLPGGQRYTVRRPLTRDDEPTTGALSGPDTDGRLVVINDNMTAKHHDIEVLTLWGTSLRTLFRRSGDATWDHVIGESLALAPTGGRVAFISRLQARQMPGALLQEGTLEVWNVGDGVGGPTKVTALDNGLRWLPDSRRLLYANLVPAAEVSSLPLDHDGFGQTFGTWPAVPVVHLLDVPNGQTRRLHVGWRPVPDATGVDCLVCDYDGHVRRVALATGKSEPQRMPGPSSGPVALIGGDLLVYNGLPTAGTKVDYTHSYSPLVGPRWNRVLKVADLKSGAFQTLMVDIDPRDEPTLGCPLAQP